MQRRIALIFIILSSLIFIASIALGLDTVTYEAPLDKIPVQIQVIDSRESTNSYSFDGRPRYWDLTSQITDKGHAYYRILYRGTLKSGDVVEFWEWVEYEEYVIAKDYLGE